MKLETIAESMLIVFKYIFIG